MRKELIEFTTNGLSHAAEHQRHRGIQWQCALARENSGMIGVDSVQEEFGRAQALCKMGRKRVEGYVDERIKIL